MITPNKIKIDGDEISNEDLLLEVKRTYLYLQKALLKLGLTEEMEEVGKSYERFKKLPQEPEEIFTEEQKKIIKEIPF
jgi:hypothetical protein